LPVFRHGCTGSAGGDTAALDQPEALQSYLFFGSANRLYQHVKALLADRPECRFLLFDFD
jgi:hypothetical protein